ncbi:MAG: LptE family protein [Candidatus Firestonebacteria bacterium]
MKKVLFLIAGLVLLTGCASMKSNLDPEIKKITIPVVINGTSQYGIDTEMTDFIIKQFLIDGRLQVVAKDQADALLEGTIRQYQLQPMAYDVNNVIISYRVKIILDVKFTNLRTGKIMWEQKEIGGIGGGATTFTVQGTNIETESVARQRVYRSLAEGIVNRVIYGWENY